VTLVGEKDKKGDRGRLAIRALRSAGVANRATAP